MYSSDIVLGSANKSPDTRENCGDCSPHIIANLRTLASNCLEMVSVFSRAVAKAASARFCYDDGAEPTRTFLETV